MGPEIQKNQMIDPADDLFGEPPLVRGEDKERYLRLLAAIEQEIEPKTVFDKIRARELADKYWEKERCKTNSTSLVECSYIEALASLLQPFLPPLMMSIGEDRAYEIAREYYNGEATPTREQEIALLLTQYRITSEQIRAKAMQLCGGGVLMFNRLENNCETSLRGLRKEQDRLSASKVAAPSPGPTAPEE